MKPVQLFLISLAAIAVLSFKSGGTCESFFPQNTGSAWVISHYNDKDKLMSVSKAKLVSINNISGGIEATINQELSDDKGKVLSSGDVVFRCTADSFYMDMSDMFNNNPMAATEGAEVTMTNQFMGFPSNPTPGQTMPDASPSMTISMNGVQMMSMTINITNRKVEAIESVTTPAGTYECYKFSEDSEVKSMFIKTKSHNVTWMARNIGMVKTESYDDKGKLQSKSILTSFTN